MRVREADALRVESVSLDHVPDFPGLGDTDLRKQIEVNEGSRSITQGSESELSDNERVRGNLIAGEQIPQFRQRRSKMVDPDGSIGENHRFWTRRRGMSSSSGMVPPRAASRCAASR